VKLSVSLSPQDVTVLDAYVKRMGLASRSAGVQHAVQLLRFPALEDDYVGAWAEWIDSEDATAWEGTVGDGVTDAAR
jgi:hypothetical protein